MESVDGWREPDLLVAFQVSADRTAHERGRLVGLGAKAEPLNQKPTIMVGKSGGRVNPDDLGDARELPAAQTAFGRRFDQSIETRFMRVGLVLARAHWPMLIPVSIRTGSRLDERVLQRSVSLRNVLQQVFCGRRYNCDEVGLSKPPAVDRAA